ncbi:hypothetical protein KMW28_17370 [Flammeovirga yaeyamensis]|uniref:Secreted protein n=1 Tax=Flammeovirga yaeyamensis TaxID=367791 RepID=A0AAX1N1R5_9BACT|nr:hypothetical protein [Flammeovirga yaeyamensis]MBB3698210.1 hypothetical protein [Flammeovirga yaeyamensis]NMF34435.1 hypothetical protein [Flammeovirga yaeyamensis]QWG01414.1 hypothetical protein KMW28_17370 [Flammeovirga yaeyamensis]
MKNLFITLFILGAVAFNSLAQDHPKGYLSITTSGSGVLQRNAHSFVMSADYNHYVSDRFMIGMSVIGDWEKEYAKLESGTQVNDSFKSSVAFYGTYLFGKNRQWGLGGGYSKDILKGDTFKLGNDYVDAFVMYFIPVGNLGYICPRVGYIHDFQGKEQSISAGFSFSVPIN